MSAATYLGQLSDYLTTRMLSQHRTDASADLVRDRQGVVRKAQISAIMATSQPMMIANILNIAALIALEHHVGSLSGWTLAWSAIVVAFAIYGLRSAHRFKKAPRRPTASPRAPGKIVISSALLALVWCYPLIVLLPHGELLEVAFLSALVAGMIAGGALALYPVPLAGLLYTSTLSCVAFVMIIFNGILPILPFGIVIAAFCFIVYFSVRRHTSMFLSELLGKMEAERQRDVVALLLDTFQGEGGQYIWRADKDLTLKTDPEPLCQMLGLPAPKMAEPNLLTILDQAKATDHNPDFSMQVSHLQSPDNTLSGNFETTLKIHHDRVIRLASRPDPGESGPTAGYHGYIKDVTAETQAKAKIYQLATRDTMTSLLNYSTFNERARNALADLANTDQKALFVFIDADNLKPVNDNFGHAAGDVLIRTLASRFEAQFHLPSLIGRKGGDEFVALAFVPPDTDETAWGRDLVACINGRFHFGEAEIPLSCCIGISVADDVSASLRALEVEADRALYRAKSRGKGEVSVYDAAIGIEIHRDRLLANDIQDAMQKRHLTLEFQAIVDLKTDAIVGAEALARWDHPILGAINPEKVVAVAQAEGLGPAFLDYILQVAATNAKAWPGARFLSVNMNSADLQQTNLASRVADILCKTGFAPQRLWLEVTETGLLLDSDAVQANLRDLRAQGIRIAIDDFGTGYSSLGYLGRYPTDILKIDKSLIEDLDTDESSQIIVKAIRELAQTNGFQLVAEGVETQNITRELNAAGIEMGQGFAFYRPMTPARFSRLLHRRHAEADADQLLLTTLQSTG